MNDDEVAESWRMYAQLQAELSNTKQLSDRSWGLEAGLDAILDGIAGRGVPSVPPDKAVASAGRRERHRARLRRVHAARLEPSGADGPDRIYARMQLADCRRALPGKKWLMACHMAVGSDQRDVAKLLGKTVGNVRTDMTRIRKALRKSVR